MAGREYWSRSAPTGRSPSSVKWLCCAIGAGNAAAFRSAAALCACKCTKKCGGSCERGGVFCAVFALRDESAQWAEKSGEFSAENGLLLCETRGLSSENSPLFLRPSRRVNLRWPGAVASLGSGGGKRRDVAASKGKKIPVFAEARTGSCGRKTTERGMIKGLCSCL